MWKLMAATLGCLVPFAMADKVMLKDGSVLVGSIGKIHEGKVMLKTSFAGELGLDQTQVIGITTDGPVNLALSPTNKVQGTLTMDGDGKVLANGQVVDMAALTAMWPSGGEDPTLPPPPKPRKWKYEVDIDVTGKTGNTEKFTGGGGAKATLSGDYDQFIAYVQGRYSKENGVKTEEKIVGGLDYERRIMDTKNSWYSKLRLEHDEIDGYDFYSSLGAGYGYYLMDEEDAKIRLRGGFSYIHRAYTDDTKDDDDMAVDFGYHHEFKIKLGLLVTDVTYTPAVDDFKEDYRLFHESSLAIATPFKNLSFKIGVSNEYNSKVAAGRSHMDTTYFGKLVYTWE